MTHDRDIERLLGHWLGDGPTQAPDRVLDIVADRIERQAQRPAWRLDWRHLNMNAYAKLAIAAAAVLLVAVIGSAVLPRFHLGVVGSPKPLIEVQDRYDASALGLDRPIDLAIAPNGDLYVAASDDRISQISPSGKVVRSWGTTGSGPGQFDFNGLQSEDGAYASLAIGPGGQVYVSDSNNHRVQVFTADGTFVRKFGNDGTARGQFRLPFDLSVDGAGNVYVLDDIMLRLTKFAPEGPVLWIADAVTDPVLDGHGHDAQIDSKGRIVVGNDDNGKVVFLDPSGTVLDSFDADACNVTSDPADNLYVGGCGSDHVTIYDPSHHPIGTWSDTLLRATPRFGPNGEVFALDPAGNILRLAVNLPGS
jgi:DNA-binding beta-propeller fold protein YncE